MLTTDDMTLNLPKKLLAEFRRGIYESAAKTDGWILTDGTNNECNKEVGKARQLYNAAFHDEGPVPFISLLRFIPVELNSATRRQKYWWVITGYHKKWKLLLLRNITQ